MRRHLVTFLFAFHMLASPTNSQEPVRSVQSTHYSDNERIDEVHRLLEQPSPIRGLENPIPLQQLMSMFPFVVWIDDKALDEESISPSEPIQIPRVPGIRIRNQLEWILQPLQLTYVVKPGYLAITSKKSSANIVRLYDVSRLVNPPDTTQTDNLWNLIALLERTISADEWQCNGGNSTMTAWRTDRQDILVVSAPEETHNAIRDLFFAQAELVERSIREKSHMRNRKPEIRSSGVRRSRLKAGT